MTNKAEFILSAKDMTGPAFATMNRNLDKLESQARDTEVAVGGFELSARNLGLSVAAGTAAIAAALPQLTAYGREIQLQAQMADMGTDEFQSWAYAVDTVGIRMDKLADISKDVKDKLGDFIANGGGEFADFFENVAPAAGVTAKELAALAGPDALLAIKSAMDEVNVSAAEQIFYFEAIANDASMLIPLLADNGTELRRLRQEFDQLDLAVTEQELERLSTMATDLSRIWTAMKNTAAAAASTQADTFHGWSDAVVGSFGAAAQSFRQWQDLLNEDTTAGQLWDVVTGGLLEAQFMKDYGVRVGLDAKEAGTFSAEQFSEGFNGAMKPGFVIPESDSKPAHNTEAPLRPASDIPVFNIEVMTEEDWNRQQRMLEELDRLMARAATTGLDSTQRMVVAYDQQMAKLDEYAAKHPELATEIERSRSAITASYYAALDREASKRDAALEAQLTAYRTTHAKEETQLKQALDTRLEALQQFRDTDKISNAEYLAEKRQAEEDYTDALNKLNEKRNDDTKGYLEKMRDELKKSTEGFDSVWGQSLDRLSAGFGEVAETAVFDSDNIGEAFTNMFEGLGRSVVSFFGEWMGQYMALWILEQTIGAAKTASYSTSVAGRGAAEMQLGAINAAAAVAATPVIGPSLVPGAIAAFEGLTAPLLTAAVTAASASGIAGVAHAGMDAIPREGTYLLDGGEAILQPEANRDLRAFLRSANAAPSAPVTEQYIIQAQDSRSFVQAANRNRKGLTKALKRTARNQAQPR